MLGAKLPENIDHRLSRLCEKTKRSKSYYARKALEEFLEDQADYYLAHAHYEEYLKTGEGTTLEELEEKYGLNDDK